MKTLPAITIVTAAFTAFALVPLTFEAACSVLFATGLALIVYGDYARTIRPVKPCPANVASAPRTERFGLAA